MILSDHDYDNSNTKKVRRYIIPLKMFITSGKIGYLENTIDFLRS